MEKNALLPPQAKRGPQLKVPSHHSTASKISVKSISVKAELEAQKEQEQAPTNQAEEIVKKYSKSKKTVKELDKARS